MDAFLEYSDPPNETDQNDERRANADADGQSCRFHRVDGRSARWDPEQARNDAPPAEGERLPESQHDPGGEETHERLVGLENERVDVDLPGGLGFDGHTERPERQARGESRRPAASFAGHADEFCRRRASQGGNEKI